MGAKPRMGGRRVVVPPVVLGVLAVVALPAVEAEEPVLDVTIAAVPHGQGEREVLVQVAQAEDAVLTPTEGARSGGVVRDVAPGVPIRGVVLTDRPPGSLGEIRPPEVPRTRLVRTEAVVAALGHPGGFAGDGILTLIHPPILPLNG